MLRDPNGSWSSARIAALICVVCGCGIAIAGMWLNREQAATVAALMGGGAGTFFSRSRKPT